MTLNGRRHDYTSVSIGLQSVLSPVTVIKSWESGVFRCGAWTILIALGGAVSLPSILDCPLVSAHCLTHHELLIQAFDDCNLKT